MENVRRYQPLLVVLHWLMAILLPVALIGGAFALVKIPNSDPAKISALRQHMIGGGLLLSLMLIRLIVRMRTVHPPPASAGNPVLDRIAWLSHRLLYVLVFAQAGSGLYMALETQLPAVLFGGRGALPADFWVFPVRSAHYVISRLLMAVIILHVGAALYHTFVLRDGLLRRMWFGKRASVPEPVAPAPGQSLS